MQTASQYQRFLITINYANISFPETTYQVGKDEDDAIGSVLWWKGEYTDHGLGERTIKAIKVDNEGMPI